jgi:phage replication initiation protein
MTKANDLVLDGETVKLRLLAERTAHKTPVHVDWVRFTCLLRNAPAPSIERLFPASVSVWDKDYRQAQMQKILRDIPDYDFVPSAQALDLATEICAVLGEGFTVSPEVRKGHDFYRFRWSIERQGAECGWVGYLASGNSPRESSQGQTIHANLYGHACTFAAAGWHLRLADLVDSHHAKITRADLALDLFEGLTGGMESLEADYKNGVFDVQGKRPKAAIVGDWFNGCERSLYIGSKGAGKQTNIYEKGDQLFGAVANSPWVRVELRYGNKLRVIESDILRRPADFFAGASDWHHEMLNQTGAEFSAQACPQDKRLPVETVLAEVTRNIRWAVTTASQTIATAFRFLPESEFLELVNWETKLLPGRLRKFTPKELGAAFSGVMGSFSTVEHAPAFG